jgi:hypothetical protein
MSGLVSLGFTQGNKPKDSMSALDEGHKSEQE